MSSENKGAAQLLLNSLSALLFSLSNIWFSSQAAHMISCFKTQDTHSLKRQIKQMMHTLRKYKLLVWLENNIFVRLIQGAQMLHNQYEVNKCFRIDELFS